MSVDGRVGSGPDGLARTRPERALLLAVDTGSAPWSISESLDELEELARTAGAQVVGRVSQRLEHPDPKTYLGRGKLNEARDLAVESEADLIIVDDELAANTQRSMEEILGRRIVDRSLLILDIFAKRAKTREGKWQVELVDDVDEIFRRSDYVTLHAPGDSDNQSIVNAARLALMKPAGVLINTARGVLVDEDALYAALVEGRIAGAGLDVRVHEPPKDDRFEALDNVVLTPHVSGSTQEAQAVSAVMVVDSVLQAARGETPHGLINTEIWDRRRR